MANVYIVRVMSEDYPSRHRYRIIEKVSTVDGPRDRITSVSYETLEEAERRVKELRNG